MKVKDKVFVVTGGGNGIGRELVLGLLARGARVAAVDVDGGALEKTVELSGEKRSRLTSHFMDITDKKLVEALPGHIISLHGAVDGMINDAGIIQPFEGLQDIELDTITRVMDVNFYGTLYMTKTFLPYLLTRPEAHITNISSMGGFLPVPGQTVYGASKAAVKILTEGLSLELKSTKTKVMLVLPGGIGTDIMKNSGVTMSPKMEKMQKTVKITTPEKAAQRIIRGIEKNRHRVLVGPDSAFTDLLYRLGPKQAAQLLNFIMRRILAD